jgi:hypothetical protein
MDDDQQKGKQPYRETLDAARIFEEISSSAGKRQAKPSGQPEGPESGGAQEAEQPETAGVGATSELTWPPASEEGPGGRDTKGDELSGLPAGEAAPVAQTAPEEKEPSIGELFSKLVKMSPPDKIRIEQDSIGSLFKKFITKRG